MAYVIWKIFLKQYSSFRFDATATTTTTPAVMWRQYPAAIVGTLQNNNNNNNTSNNSTNATRPLEGREYAATLPQLSNNNNNNINNGNNIETHLAEVLVVNDTKIDAPLAPAAASAAASSVVGELNAAIDSRSGNGINEGITSMSGRQRCNDSTAPIAHEEQADDEEEMGVEVEIDVEVAGDCRPNHAEKYCWQIDAAKTEKTSAEKPPSEAAIAELIGGDGGGGGVVGGNTTVRRSKSRVRTYLQKCKERLTGQHHHAAATSTSSTRHSSTDVERQLTAVTEETIAECRRSITTTRTVELTGDCHSPLTLGVSTTMVTTLPEEEDDACSYEDIDFGLSSLIDSGKRTTAECTDDNDGGGLLAEIEARQAEMHLEALAREAHLAHTLQMESGIAALIDSHLARIYPVYFECTRAILIRQARDLLVCSFHGCLQSFEKNFLCKFTQIASELKQKHAVGEALLWCQGWPLATPTGELILHLGALDDALLRPAEIYLCVKAVNNSNATPELHAVWRSADTEAIVQNRCIDYSDPKAYLSVLTLEMLSGDELPQLLQNLLVGVERSIGRISLNELQMPNAGDHQYQQQHLQLPIGENCNNNGNNTAARSSITNSPKCALKRSELITKNKMLSHKYMLRRLTNRQDSMNSTSSGNSCASSGSASSDELLYCNNNNNNSSSSNNPTDAALQTTTTQSASTSPALPLFCLGNSFPHIDSDEENSDEKRHSLDIDRFENEILPPGSITEIPEKLLTTGGIFLPGTRDLQGNPIVTVEPERIIASGLNCYEIATALLFYSTIPESNSNASNGNATQQFLQSPAASPVESTITANTTNNSNSNSNSNSSTTNNNNNNIIVTKPAQKTFTILIAIEKSQHLCVIDLICQSLKLLTRQIAYCEILAVCLDRSLLQLCKNNATATATAKATNSECVEQQQRQQQEQHQQQHSVRFISVDEVTTSVATSQIPHGKLRGLHHHDARKWREFFIQLEPFQRQSAAAGQRLVAAMSDIRSADLQGLPTRRQLYAQHRALSRALMDSELHNLRKRGATTLMQLQELAKIINNNSSNNNSNSNRSGQPLSTATKKTTTTATSTAASTSSNYSFTTNNNNNNNNNKNNISHISHNSSTKSSSSSSATVTSSGVDNTNIKTTTTTTTSATSHLNSSNNNINNINSNSNIDVAIRLHKVTLLFNEVDRAAKRLEQLTEQRRERLRELTRRRALEDEINEVTSWITGDGNEKLQRFANLQLDCETAIKEHEQEFEKYYFVSMKHLAKGRDLHVAAANMDTLRESASNLKSALDCFAEKLEQARERIEGATRLHHLLNLHMREENVQQEMERLAEQIGVPGLLEKYRQQHQQQQQQQQHQTQLDNLMGSSMRIKPNSLNLNFSHNTGGGDKSYGMMMNTSTPSQQKPNRSSHRSSSGIGSFDGCHCWHESRNLEDMDELLDADEEDDGEEQQSKIADSGLGGCDRCEGNPKLTRICSCQSLNEAGNLYDKSHNSDELDDECFERPSKRYLDIHSPMEANAHLQCFASTFELPKMEEHSCLDPKIQKTLLLIMREMICTERDYVRSLYYVIENYVDELLRDDIPQPLRGQRNVIFGNIEKIFEFHSSHFLSELERYERNPLKVGAAFLQMESKFYLYALYNKNKPKSDTLLSEYGTAFFKSKQFELNDKMDLASYLLKPVQRMGKYALLLQQLVKACSTVEGDTLQEIGADVEELQQAEEMVKFQLRHGNDLLAMDSLRDCDVNVKEQGRLLRQNEFLVWQGRGGKKTLRQIFLFEDLVLFSKARRFPDHKNLDIYLYKNSIKTSDIGLTAHIGDSPTKFEIWFRKRKPEDTWTMQCMSEDIKNAWTEEISRLLWQQAKRNREIRLAEMSSMGIGSKPCLDIRPSNNQINDRSITITQLGKAPKLRHSFVGLHPEQGSSTTRRPNSLISESSLSSGTSSSSLSTGSSSGGHERAGGGSLSKNHGLELINETQALMLSCGTHSSSSSNSNSNNKNNKNISSNTLNSNSSSSSSSGAVSANLRNHKRSTTLVSQLSMESGILSDISMTPDQEQPEMIAATTTPIDETTTTATVVVMRRHKKNINILSPVENKTDIGGNPYLKDKEETVNL